MFKLSKDFIKNIKKPKDGNFFFITTNLSFFLVFLSELIFAENARYSQSLFGFTVVAKYPIFSFLAMIETI